MADGKTHLRVALVTDVFFSAGAFYLYTQGYGAEAVGVMTGALLGTLITPDYDVNGSTITEKLMRHYLGVVGDWWVAEWHLYALWNKHRGRFSHKHLIGTVTRAIYLIWRLWERAVFLVGLHALYGTPLIQFGGELPGGLLVSLLLVWAIHDSLHIIYDGG